MDVSLSPSPSLIGLSDARCVYVAVTWIVIVSHGSCILYGLFLILLEMKSSRERWYRDQVRKEQHNKLLHKASRMSLGRGMATQLSHRDLQRVAMEVDAELEDEEAAAARGCVRAWGWMGDDWIGLTTQMTMTYICVCVRDREKTPMRQLDSAIKVPPLSVEQEDLVELTFLDADGACEVCITFHAIPFV
jgi:hypothetical protein